MTAPSTLKINLIGGIISAGDLYEILESAERAGVETLQLGNRQQMYLQVAEDEKATIERELLRSGIEYEINEDRFSNLVSSYVCADIFPSTPWLSEGVYKDVLGLFNFSPVLKINLTDPRQCLIPGLNGNLNFIASETSHYWYLQLRFPRTNTLYLWPSLIYTDEIALISASVEKMILNHKELYYANVLADGQELYLKVQKTLKTERQNYQTGPGFSAFELPRYEGFHPYNNRLWLGIYQRNEQFSLRFLKELCLLAIELKLGQLYTSPWKSLIIKGIQTSDRPAWEELLRRHEINYGHSLNELNWQVEDLSENELRLKQFLVEKLDAADISTAGLCFAIKSKPGSGLFGSIAIRIESKENKKDKFSIEYSADFDAHSRQFIPYKTKLGKSQLGPAVITLCRQFSTRKKPEQSYTPEKTNSGHDQHQRNGHLYECMDCMTRFDEDLGDTLRNIPPGTDFLSMESYICPLCDAPMEKFRSIPVNCE